MFFRWLFGWIPSSLPFPMPAETGRQKHPPFVPGQWAYWCGQCWGIVAVTRSRNDHCPRCRGPLRFVATAMRDTAPVLPKRDRERLTEKSLSLADVNANPLNFLTEHRAIRRRDK